MTIHKEGFKIIGITTLIIFIFGVVLKPFIMANPFIQYIYFGVAGLLLVLVLQFFRKPKRIVNPDLNRILSPCDGKVVVIEETEETEFYKDKRIQVSIFMSPLNVHINWSPISGIVKYAKYHAGLFLVAWHPKSSTDNERTTIVVENEKISVLFRQIAGAVARRIRYYVKPEDNITQGDEFGFIKFGSRVDIFLPVGTPLSVKIGDKTVGNKTVIAELS